LSRSPRVAGETAICSAAVPSFVYLFLALGQHIDKPISDVSSRINALQTGVKLAVIAPKDFSAT